MPTETSATVRKFQFDRVAASRFHIGARLLQLIYAPLFFFLLWAVAFDDDAFTEAGRVLFALLAIGLLWRLGQAPLKWHTASLVFDRTAELFTICEERMFGRPRARDEVLPLRQVEAVVVVNTWSGADSDDPDGHWEVDIIVKDGRHFRLNGLVTNGAGEYGQLQAKERASEFRAFIGHDTIIVPVPATASAERLKCQR